MKRRQAVKEPRIGATYLYMMDMVWVGDSLSSEKIRKGTRVTDLRRGGHKERAFCFRLCQRDPKMAHGGQWLSCNYDWAFVRDTWYNRRLIAVEAGLDLAIRILSGVKTLVASAARELVVKPPAEKERKRNDA